MSTTLRQTGLILRNDLRLLWRDFRSGKLKIFSNFLLIGALILGTHAVTILIFSQLNQAPPLALEAGLWAFFAFLMLGTAMNKAISLFFERADFDLLLSSPLPVSAILLARLAILSIAAFLGVGLMLMPLLDGIIIGFSLNYLFGYSVWALLAVLGACLGIGFTIALVRLLGPRGARIWIQIVAAILGASVYLLFQLQNHLPHAQRIATWDFLRATSHRLGFPHFAQAARGSWLDLLLLALITAVAAFATSRLLARTFLAGLQESHLRPARALRPGRKSYRFSGGLARATFRKDLRLILRDPLLLSQMLPSIMYIAPAFFAFRQFGATTVLAPIAVVLAVQFSSILSDVAVTGEECLDLIRASPSPETRLRPAKMVAGMVLPLAAALLVCAIVAALGRPWLALLTFITAAITASGAAWLAVTRVVPMAREDLLRRRRRKISLGRSLTIGLLLLLAGFGISLVAQGTLWFLGIIALGLDALAVIACFTFVGIEEIATDSEPCPPPSAIPS